MSTGDIERQMPTCEEWKRQAIEHFKSGHATDEHWDVMASCLLVASEGAGLDGDLEELLMSKCEVRQ